MSTLFVGIDVSKKNNAVYMMMQDGSLHSSFSIKNAPDGVKKLSDEIVNALDHLNLSEVVIGIEATSYFGDHLVDSLRQNGKLGRFAPRICVLNPKQVKGFKEIYPETPKNDLVDAYVIADYLRFRHPNLVVYNEDCRYQSLRMLTRERFFAVKNLARVKQRFAKYLFLKCSGLALDENVSHTSATFIALMEHYASVDELASAKLDDLTDFIAKSGRGRFQAPENIAKIVQAAARGSFRLPKTVNDSVNQAMSISIFSIRFFEGLIKEYDKEIATLLEAMPNALISIPGIGPVLSAGIIAEIGDIRRFQNQSKLAKYAGLAWLQHQSGETEFKQKRKVKTGNRFLGYYLREGANSVRRHDLEYRQYYEEKLNGDKRYQHKRALSLTTRKFVRLVFSLLKDNRMYRKSEK